MPIATFERQDLPAGFATKTRFYKIARRAQNVELIDMTCPHRGGPLTHGSCEDDRIVCPWHRGRISLRKIEQQTQPSITTPDRVMFVVESAITRVFHSLPVDCSNGSSK